MVNKIHNSFLRHCTENQWESIRTGLTYESAQIKLFSRLLGRYTQIAAAPVCILYS